MFDRMVFCLVALTMMVGATLGAQAEERFALVLGNSNYKSIAALTNPVNDVEAVDKLLNSAGFDVTKAVDLGQAEMRSAVSTFAAKLAGKSADSVALVYFAGHGVQIDGQNYLLPVDAEIKQESDVALAGIRLSDVMNVLNSLPSKTRIVILDACRNNPFDELKNRLGRGLAVVNAPAGTVVAYSTSPGYTAADGDTNNSPFTKAFVEAAAEPGALLGTILQNTRVSVHNATKGRQVPWEVSALTTKFRFFESNTTALAPVKIENTPEEWREDLRSRSVEDAYDIVVRENNIILYQIFINIFPQTPGIERVRVLVERQMEMLAWYDAVTLNSVAAYEEFLKRFPGSDLEITARRLMKRVEERMALSRGLPGALDVASNLLEPVVKEVKVPVYRDVVKEVEVPVIKTVIKKVPQIKWREKIVTRTVVKKVPVIKWREKIVRVPVVKWRIKKVPVIKWRIKKVRVPRKCNCRRGSSTTRIN